MIKGDGVGERFAQSMMDCSRCCHCWELQGMGVGVKEKKRKKKKKEKEKKLEKNKRK